MIDLVLYKVFFKQDADKTLGCSSKEDPFKGLWYKKNLVVCTGLNI